MSLPTLTDHQWEAVKEAAHWFRTQAQTDRSHVSDEFGTYYGDGFGGAYLGKGQDFFLGGYAGTGKSTILPYVIEEMGLEFSQVAFCAPTGKAAKIMTEKLHAFGIWQTATTIHKLIYMPKAERSDAIKRKIDEVQLHLEWITTGGTKGRKSWDEEIAVLTSPKEVKQKLTDLTFELHRAMDRDGPAFTRRERGEFPEHVQLVVVDEGSMVGEEIADDLAFFGRPIFVMGDPGQLPPVADKYGFNCLQPDTFLTEVHRQAEDSPIIHLATLVRQ